MRKTIIDVSNMELTEKVVTIKRVTKVVKGGRNMRFTALVVVGDMNGHVGAGLGKATEIPEAIRKGKEDAIKNLVSVATDENMSITHDFIGKFGSASVLLKKAPDGTGIIAGGAVRTVLELAGIKNIRAKCLRSNNPTNVVKATFEGLKTLRTAEQVAAIRDKSVDDSVIYLVQDPNQIKSTTDNVGTFANIRYFVSLCRNGLSAAPKHPSLRYFCPVPTQATAE